MKDKNKILPLISMLIIIGLSVTIGFIYKDDNWKNTIQNEAKTVKNTIKNDEEPEEKLEEKPGEELYEVIKVFCIE